MQRWVTHFKGQSESFVFDLESVEDDIRRESRSEVRSGCICGELCKKMADREGTFNSSLSHLVVRISLVGFLWLVLCLCVCFVGLCFVCLVLLVSCSREISNPT